MQFVVIPLFERWSEFNGTPLSKRMLQNVISNKKIWDDASEGKTPSLESEIRLLPPLKTTVQQHSVQTQVHISAERSRESLAPAIVTDHHNGGSPPKETPTTPTDSKRTKPSYPSLCNPLVPVTEGVEVANWTGRRHSLPPPSLAKDLALLLEQSKENIGFSNNGHRTAIIPNGGGPAKLRCERRRHSLPQGVMKQLIGSGLSSVVGKNIYISCLVDYI